MPEMKTEIYLHMPKSVKILQDDIMLNFIQINFEIYMKLEICSEKLITKQNILMVLYLLNKFHLKLKYSLVHLLLTPNSAFCSYTLLSAPGTMQITFLFSHLATFVL